MNDAPTSLCDPEIRIERFFNRPGTLELFRCLESILAGYDGVVMSIQKTQIAFSHGKRMAFVSLPFRKVKGRPDVHVVLTLGLGRRAEHPLLAEAVEPYPGRWTNHFIISDSRISMAPCWRISTRPGVSPTADHWFSAFSVVSGPGMKGRMFVAWAISTALRARSVRCV